MSKKSQVSQKTPGAPSVRTLTTLTALGAVTGMWAVFQWGELLVSRMGGTPFCSLDATFDCSKVWDSAFASAVHSMTGLPIAGWGLVWGIVAFIAPLLALHRRAQGQSVGAAWPATLLAGAAGAVTIVVMIAASVAAGALCISCIGTYLVVGAYSAVALMAYNRQGTDNLQNGLGMAAVATVLAYLVLLVPGMRTPSATATRDAIADAIANVGDSASNGADTANQADPARKGSPALAEFLSKLPTQLKQGVSDSLAIYRAAPKVAARSPRGLRGSIDAPLRITDFTDVLCGHCAELHETLRDLEKSLPPGLIAIDSRQFPLDSECNPTLKSPAKLPVRCLAAKALICLSSHEKAFDFSGELFANQRDLTVEKVYALAAPYLSRGALDACVAAPETQTTLIGDIQWAIEHELDGTPLVLINGRRATSFGPFLFALALSGLDLKDPAFASLPPPNPSAHMH